MTPGLFQEILSWVVPPITGAVIGWVTNDIAIRMLFRPLREVRLLGVRLPFTPGIFPKERHTLARSIGRMVSSELITEDALRRQVHADRAQEALARSISEVTEQVLQSPLSAVSRAGSAAFASSLQDVLHGLLRSFLGSGALIDMVREVIGRAVASLSARRLRDVVERADLKGFVTDRVLPLLAREDTRQSIGRAVGEVFGQQAPAIISDELLASVSTALEPVLPPAIERLAAWLRSPQMLRELESRGAGLLSRVLEKLNIVQRFLISAGQFDRRLAEKMPEIVEDAISTLEAMARDPDRQRRLLGVLAQAVRDWRQTLDRTTGEAQTAGKLADAVAGLVDRFLAGLADGQARQKVYARLESAMFGRADPSVGGFARQVLGIRDEDAVDYLSTRILQYLSRPETAETLSVGMLGLAGRFLQDHSGIPLGEVLRVDAARKERLDAFLLSKLVQVIDAKLPDILRGIDVERLVVEKIDALDVKDVERLIRQVIATHLKWINVFGAILGFLIGLVQDLFRLLRLW